MDNLIDELTRAGRRCERAYSGFKREPVKGMIRQLMDACDELGKAWSGSFIGYQASVYTVGLRPVRPGEFFNREWGPSRSIGEWTEYSFEEVREIIEQRANIVNIDPINDASANAGSTFDAARDDIVPALDALLSTNKDDALLTLRNSIANLESHTSMDTFARNYIPGGNQVVRDSRALSGGGYQVGHHIRYQAWLMERASYGHQVAELGRLTSQALKYLKHRLSLKGNTVAKTDGTIFIGHGRSNDWRDLKDLLHDRLNLQSDEFNRESAAGIGTKDRLEQMLDKASFAFLVMTAEDEQADGSKQARANVIHEVGLFQGRLGFERAIVLLEDGCSEFSNIVGLGQIRFSKGNIRAKSEEIRMVLERENIIGPR